MDAASVSFPSSRLAWHENLDGNGTAWTTHTIGTNAGFALDLADIDRDGDLDVVAEPGDDKSPLRWYRNDGAGAVLDRPYDRTLPVRRSQHRHRGPRPGWGIPDVLALFAGHTLWFENTDGGANWLSHFLGGVAPTGVAAADMDRDGDPDVIGAVRVVREHPGSVVDRAPLRHATGPHLSQQADAR